ncbi:bifunctional DNA primase/polymerase, partial [Streptomyces sp. NPDC048376]
MNTQLNAALEAAERGWHVFPLRPADKRPALHGEAVCPLIGDCAGGHRKWEDRATVDPDR